jgi:hypothetical protein
MRGGQAHGRYSVAEEIAQTQPRTEEVGGSVLAIFLCWRAKRGTSPATGFLFLGIYQNPESNLSTLDDLG